MARRLLYGIVLAVFGAPLLLPMAAGHAARTPPSVLGRTLTLRSDAPVAYEVAFRSAAGRRGERIAVPAGPLEKNLAVPHDACGYELYAGGARSGQRLSTHGGGVTIVAVRLVERRSGLRRVLHRKPGADYEIRVDPQAR
jgi:hypothetical protein